MVRRIHMLSELRMPKLVGALVGEKVSVMRAFRAMGMLEHSSDGRIKATDQENPRSLVLRGVVNNFHTRFKGGHWRERVLKEHGLGKRIGDVVGTSTTHSERYRNITFGDYFGEIDKSLGAVGIPKAARTRITTLRGAEAAAELTRMIDDIYHAYLILRIEGFNHPDLTA